MELFWFFFRILRSGCGFYCLDPEVDFQDNFCTLRTLKITHLIAEATYADKYMKGYNESPPYLTPNKKLSFKMYTMSFKDQKTVKSRPFKWAYAIRTSGTTSCRKIVLVSHESIVPNIVDMKAKWLLTNRDVIFGASPPTFDPHVVEIFLALACNGKLVYVPNSVKLNPEKLLKVLLRNKITILQCTPSLFMRFSKKELASLLAVDSPLRVLAFGGEICVERSYLQSVVSAEKDRKMMIFNLYGTTELSCWASMTRINLSENGPVSIGDLLSDTRFLFIFDAQGRVEIFTCKYNNIN